MWQPQLVSQEPSIDERDAYRIVDPYYPGVFDETDDEFEQRPSPFLEFWLNESARDSYELPELNSSSSNKSFEVGPRPGKRAWPFDMSPDALTDLHGSTLAMFQPPQSHRPPQPPQVQVFDLDEAWVRLKASSNPQKLTRRAPKMLESRRHPVDELAMTRASSSGHPMDEDLAALVDAAKEFPQGTPLHALATRRPFEMMIKVVMNLTKLEFAALLDQSRKWKSENPKAARVVALMLLFTNYTPAVLEMDEFMSLLYLTWPPKLEHLRKACFDARAAMQSTAPRTEFLRRLIKRYGD